MIVRVWRAEIDPARVEDYERFARERSLPMFRSHPGFSGAAFAREGPSCTVVTLWERRQDAAALEDSDRYRETVIAIMASGFVRRADEAVVASVLT